MGWVQRIISYMSEFSLELIKPVNSEIPAEASVPNPEVDPRLQRIIDTLQELQARRRHQPEL